MVLTSERGNVIGHVAISDIAENCSQIQLMQSQLQLCIGFDNIKKLSCHGPNCSFGPLLKPCSQHVIQSFLFSVF